MTTQMKTTLFAMTLSALALAPMVGAADARPPLREVAVVDDGLFHVALANVVRKRCDSLEGRVLKAIGILRDLKAEARALGYTDDEIDAYVDSDAEKERMKARATELLQARGFDPDKPEDLCRFGREEIALNSPVGLLLKAR